MTDNMIRAVVRAADGITEVEYTLDEWEAHTGLREPIPELSVENFPDGEYPRGSINEGRQHEQRDN